MVGDGGTQGQALDPDGPGSTMRDDAGGAARMRAMGRVTVRQEADILAARELGRRVGEAVGFSLTQRALLATAISEVARNILRYAGTGEVEVAEVLDAGSPGVEVVARDSGPGIANVELAMQDGFTSGSGLGLGLPGAARLTDEFDIDSELGRGTTVSMRMWLDPGRRR